MSTNARGENLVDIRPAVAEQIVVEATAARTIDQNDFGKLVLASYAGATTFTLPAPSAALVGAWLDVGQTVNQDLIVKGTATADNNAIIADGVLTTDQISFATTDHKVGARAHIVCVSATKWMITNTSACTMTVEAAD